MKARIFITCVIVLMSIMDGCKKSDTTPSTSTSPGTNEVWMQNTMFTPGSITVDVNTTIKWTNKDSFAHTVTSDESGMFDSGNINSNGTYSHQFTAAGTYSYHCTIHSHMTGTVIVH